MFWHKYRRSICSVIAAVIASIFFNRTYPYVHIGRNGDLTPSIMVYTGDILPTKFTSVITGAKNDIETIQSYLEERRNMEGYFDNHYIIIMQFGGIGLRTNLKSVIVKDDEITMKFSEKFSLFPKRNQKKHEVMAFAVIAYEIEGKYKGQIINVKTNLPDDSNKHYIYKDSITYEEKNKELYVLNYKGFDEVVSIPEKIKGIPVTKIGGYSFQRNETMKTLILPKTLRKMQYLPIYTCKALTQITVDDENVYFTDYEGVLFSKNLDELVMYPPGAPDETYAIPESVITVNDTAFCQFYYLKHFIVPESVTKMPTPGNMGAIRNYEISFSVKRNSYAERYVIENNYPYDYIA